MVSKAPAIACVLEARYWLCCGARSGGVVNGNPPLFFRERNSAAGLVRAHPAAGLLLVDAFHDPAIQLRAAKAPCMR